MALQENLNEKHQERDLPEGEHDHISKSAFTAVTGPAASSESDNRRDLHDIDFYIPTGEPATKKEVWSYYSYYAGNNGIGTFQYSNLLFQNLINQAGFDPAVQPLGSAPCDATTACHVFWGGGQKHKSTTSVILIVTGLTFLGQALIFISIGSLADFGSWNPWVVRIASVLCFAFEFGFLGVTTAGQWKIAMSLYIFSNITFWASVIFYNAIFPKLAHDLPELRVARDDLHNGTITEEQFERKASLARSKIMNLSWVWNNVGFTICAAICLGTLSALGANDSVHQNNWGYSVCVGLVTGWWILFAIPWFLWEKKRPGPKLPKGDNYLTFGFKQTWFALKAAWTIKQTFFYLVAFFLLADGINTVTVLVSIAQTDAVAFSATQNTYFIILQGGAALIGVFGLYEYQKFFNVSTKAMLQFTNFGCILLALWGMVGIWTDKFGYHNIWEFWLFSSAQGFSIAAQYSFGQAFMAELVPKGREFMFFSLLGIVSKGSAWIGPIVCSAIVDATGNQWTAFPFVAALIFVPWVGIFFISEKKSRVECAIYLANETKRLGVNADDSSDEKMA